MPSKRKRKKTIFESIRKPTAPPGKKMGQEKPTEKAMPSLRKAKHKELIKSDPEKDDV